MTIRAVYDKGVFKPEDPVDLPDQSLVKLVVRPISPESPPEREGSDNAQKRIYEILSRSYHTGQRDLAERHNEHQP